MFLLGLLAAVAEQPPLINVPPGSVPRLDREVTKQYTEGNLRIKAGNVLTVTSTLPLTVDDACLSAMTRIARRAEYLRFSKFYVLKRRAGTQVVAANGVPIKNLSRQCTVSAKLFRAGEAVNPPPDAEQKIYSVSDF